MCVFFFCRRRGRCSCALFLFAVENNFLSINMKFAFLSKIVWLVVVYDSNNDFLIKLSK